MAETITKEQFTEDYARKSGMTVERLKQIGFTPIPCDCGKSCCRGWQIDYEQPPMPESFNPCEVS